MSELKATNVTLLAGDASSASAELTVGEPPVRFRVQLSGVRLGGAPTFSCYATPMGSPRENIVSFKPASPQDFDCSKALPTLLGHPDFLQRVIAPLLNSMHRSS